MLGLPRSEMGAHTHRRVHTHTHAHTTGISHWLSLPVHIVEIWGLAVNQSRWKEEKPEKGSRGAVMGNPAPVSWVLCLPIL